MPLARALACVLVCAVTVMGVVDVDRVPSGDRGGVDGYFDRARGARGTLRFTHDAEAERGTTDGVRASGVGAPGMMYARVFDADGDSTFRLGAEDAVSVALKAPPSGTRYWSFTTYAYRRGGRVTMAQCSWPVNSANANVSDADGSVVIVATRSMDAFEKVKAAYAEVGFNETTINLSPLFSDVRYGDGLDADLLSISFRVAFWPNQNVSTYDALGEWSKLSWPAIFSRRARASRNPRAAVPESSPPPAVNPNLPAQIASYSESYPEPVPSVIIDGGSARRVGRTILVPVSFDSRRCMNDPFYSPWRANGVRVRSACFGATSDALYSVSRDFISRMELTTEWLVIVRGFELVSTRRATFTNVALYVTGGIISSSISARDIRIIAAIDDRSFRVRSGEFVVAFGSSANACRRVACACVIARDAPRRSSMFIIARDYLDPLTATAPISRPEIDVRVFAL